MHHLTSLGLGGKWAWPENNTFIIYITFMPTHGLAQLPFNAPFIHKVIMPLRYAVHAML